MLKPADPDPGERPIGELVQELVEEGKAYARAELDVVKAIAAAKGKALVWPAGIAFVALLCSQAAITVLAVGLLMALDSVMNPLFAGVIASLVFAAITAALGWYAYRRLRRDW
jgi:uncharacterized protein (DUF697 family)